MKTYGSTADHVAITDGLSVFTNDMRAGRVDLSTFDSEGWFDVVHLDGTRTMQNAERVATKVRTINGVRVAADEIGG